jgi:inner membrane protein
MDLLTQGLVGGLLASSAARREELRVAAGAGFVAGMLADADALIRSSSDPLLVLEYHRHFTHALVFVPVGALLAALLLWPLMRRRLGFPRLYLFSLLGYGFSGILDACTSYGTHLFWPFSDQRVAWSLISIVDPVFTLGLFAALLLALRRQTARVARVGLLFGVAYLSLGLLQHQRAADLALELADSRGHAVERAQVKPTLGNLLLWRSVYLAGGRYHVDAVRLGVFSDSLVYAGDSIPEYTRGDANRDASAGTRLHADIFRFITFSDGFVARAPGQVRVLGDVRYANLPNSTAPLWGIELPEGDGEGSVRFGFYRDASSAVRETFLEMLLGERLATEIPYRGKQVR